MHVNKFIIFRPKGLAVKAVIGWSGSDLTRVLNCLILFSLIFPCCDSQLSILFSSPFTGDWPCSGELRTQKLKSHLVRTQSLNVLPLKPEVGQYIAIRATLTARDFFLDYFYSSGLSICIFSKPLPISPVLAVANTWFLRRSSE